MSLGTPLTELFLHHPLNLSQRQIDDNDGTLQILNRKTVKLLTYNFFLRPPPIKTNEDDYKEERLQDFKSFMEDFDIICFQELFGTFSDRKGKMIKNAKERGYDYYVSSDPPSFFSKFMIDGGLLLLSRFPIIECKKLNYDCGVMSDGSSMKGALFAKIKIKNSFLCLFTTHLQASYFDSGKDLWEFSIKTREEQSELFINFIYSIILTIPKEEREKCKFLLCGDFNMDGKGKEDLIKKYNLPKLKEKEIDTFLRKLKILGKVVDLTMVKYKDYPVTFGDNSGDYDKVLSGKEDLNSNQCLDYIFEVFPDYNKEIFKSKGKTEGTEREGYQPILDEDNTDANMENQNKLFINYDATKVETFVVKDRKYQQLSDHFGVSCEITLGKNQSEDKKAKEDELIS